MYKFIFSGVLICISLSLFAFATNISREKDSLFKIQKYANQQWIVNRKLIDSLDALKFDPRLYLYSKISPPLIEKYRESEQELLRQIDFNLKLQEDLTKLNKPKISTIILNNLLVQNKQLLIAQAFNSSLIYRREHNFLAAMKEIKRVFKLINKADTHLKSLALYQKAKIHRMLAGYDLEHLDHKHLSKSEKCYLEALKLSPDKDAIHSSLGFLYLDMKNPQIALDYHLNSNHMKPNHPEYIHGLAYCYYSIEKENSALNKAMNKENLQKSEEAFEHAMQLFEQFGTQNSRLYLDRGLLKLLRGLDHEALLLFNEGLKLEAHHPLLLLERGLLLGKLGLYNDALKDLRVGRIVNRTRESLGEKYKKALADERFFSHSKTKSAFDDALKTCFEYAQKTNTNFKKPTIFISYAWDIPQHELWVEHFASDLEKAGFNVLLDRWFTRKGEETMDFVEKILAQDTDYIIVVGTKRYLEKYNFKSDIKNTRERIVRIEVRLINYLIGHSSLKSNKIIPVLLEGTVEESIPLLMRPKNIVDFVNNNYCSQILELVRDLHKINQRDHDFRKLMREMKLRLKRAKNDQVK